ncbi:MAG: flagellar hook-associated protein FlgK, partial [Myxococcota bacterium]
MAGLFSLLNVGASALFTEQRASTLAGQNIANAATPGYTRQDSVRQSVGPNGYGVRFLSAERSVDPLLRRRLEEQASVTSFSQRRADRLGALEDIASDIGPNGVSASLDNFFGSIRELTATADDPAQRQEIVSDGQTLASAVNRLGADFEQARQDLNRDIIGDIDSANAASETVARLNAAIMVTEANGAQANELRDERDAAVRQLSELVGAYGIEDEQGNVTVVANGIVLAQSDRSYTIQATPDASGTVTLEVPGTTRGDITSRIVGGSVGGAIDARDGAVADSIA